MAKKARVPPPLSQAVSDFCNLADQSSKDYDWYKEEMLRLDRLTQDYLHKLELEKLDRNQRAKIGTALSKCRRERRVAKDAMELLSPLVEFALDETNQKALNRLKMVLGKIRKTEKDMKTRVYYPRELKESEN